MRIGFLGTGKMATAITRGLIENKTWRSEKITGMDISQKTLAAFSKTTGVADCVNNNLELINKVDIMILAVKPQEAQAVASSLYGYCDNKLIISIVAGLPLRKLEKCFGHQRIVRVMPNTPATIGQGVSVYACAQSVKESDRQTVERVFGAVGLVRQLDESLLDAVTALSGSGPAYVFEMIQGLAEAGTAVGLEENLALELTVMTVAGATAMLQQGLGSPESLRNAVTSPGGTTEAGLKILREGQFRNLLKETVQAACKRAKELGKD